MSNPQQNKLTMYEAVAKVLEENKSSWQPIQILEEMVTEFTETLRDLRNKGVKRATKTTGVTLDKGEKKKVMAKKATQLAGAAFAYATKTNNKDLRAKFNYPLSTFSKIDDNNALNLALSIAEEAKKIQAQLVNYGVIPEEVNELKKLCMEFKNAIGEKANVKSGQVAATESLTDLFKKADALLKEQLDKLLLRLEDDEPEFYRTYLNARAIKSLGSRSAKKEGESGEGS